MSKPFDFTVPLRGSYGDITGMPSSITLRPIRVRDELAIDGIEGAANQELALVCSVTEQSKNTLLELESADYQAVIAKLMDIRAGKHLGGKPGKP